MFSSKKQASGGLAVTDRPTDRRSNGEKEEEEEEGIWARRRQTDGRTDERTPYKEQSNMNTFHRRRRFESRQQASEGRKEGGKIR